jgi:hypothetical protein
MIVRWICLAACLVPAVACASERLPCHDPGAANAVGMPCLLAAAEEQRTRGRRSAPPTSEVDVDPYGDPIWQESGARPDEAKPRPRVKRSQSKPRGHAKKRLHAKPRAKPASAKPASAKPASAKPASAKLRHPRAAPVGRPLNISPTSINRR